jgi:hypothetical protein
MAQKPLQLVNGRLTEVEASTTSAGAGDSGKIPALDAAGRLHSSMMPVGIGADTASIPAFENLAAGDFVNVYDDAGTARCRKADASVASAARRAHGFVLDNVTAPANATVYFEGQNTARTGLTAGTTYVLSHSTPGGVVALASASTTAGHSLQVVGDAISTTTISTEINPNPIIRG